MIETYTIIFLWAFSGFLFLPILLCFILFGIAKLKGWNDPNITPIQIIDRIFGLECVHKFELYGSNQAAHYEKCTICGKILE